MFIWCHVSVHGMVLLEDIEKQHIVGTMHVKRRVELVIITNCKCKEV